MSSLHYFLFFRDLCEILSKLVPEFQSYGQTHGEVILTFDHKKCNQFVLESKWMSVFVMSCLQE